LDLPAVAVILLVGLAAYGNSLRGAFIFDDITGIVENPHIRALWPPWQALTAPPGTGASGRPVVALSLALNYAVGGLAVFGYHAFNVAVHLACGLALFGLLRRTLDSPQMAEHFRGVALWLGLAVAVLWVAHPLTTDALNHVIYRNEALMALFYVLTLYCVARAASGSHARGWTAGAIAACALGMASKEAMVTAPLAAWAYDRAFWSGSWRTALVQRRTLYVGLGLTWLVLAAATLTGYRGESILDHAHVPPFWYAVTQAGVVLHYLRLSFWPHPLVLDLGDWRIAESLTDAGAGIVVVPLLLLATVWALFRRPRWAMAGILFFLVLAPTSSVIPLTGEIAAEHRTYLPLTGVIALVVVGTYELLFSADARVALLPRGRPRAFAAALAGAGAVVGLALTTRARNEDYRTEISIWRDTIEKRPQNYRAYGHLAAALGNRNRLEDAARWLRQGLHYAPGDGNLNENMGYVLARMGSAAEARPYFEQAVAARPDDLRIRLHYAEALFVAGNFAGAARQFAEAARIDPRDYRIQTNLGLALAAARKPAEALEHFQAALGLNAADARARIGAGRALLALGRVQAAIPELQVGVAALPDDFDARRDLAAALAQSGEVTRARQELEGIVSERPQDVLARFQLGTVLEQASDRAGAIEQYRAALKQDERCVPALNNLAWLLATGGGGVAPNDAAEAVRLAERARQLTAGRDPEILDTLAAAHLAAGDPQAALDAVSKALAVAGTNPPKELAERLAERRRECLARSAEATTTRPGESP